MCSCRCARPASSARSSALPTRTHTWMATTGAAWFSSTSSVSPLGSRCLTEQRVAAPRPARRDFRRDRQGRNAADGPRGRKPVSAALKIGGTQGAAPVLLGPRHCLLHRGPDVLRQCRDELVRGAHFLLPDQIANLALHDQESNVLLRLGVLAHGARL